MNGKLIALLIRSNASLITAIDELARQLDNGNYSDANFWNLRSEVMDMADEAETIADAQTQNEIQINAGMGIDIEAIKQASKDGAQRAFEQLSKGIQPMVPISPAHELKYQPLKLQDIAVGRVFTGKSANTGQVYTASVKVIENASGAYGKTTAIISTMLSIEGNAVSPFERPMTEDSLFKEFVCWEK